MLSHSFDTGTRHGVSYLQDGPPTPCFTPLGAVKGGTRSGTPDKVGESAIGCFTTPTMLRGTPKGRKIAPFCPASDAARPGLDVLALYTLRGDSP